MTKLLRIFLLFFCIFAKNVVLLQRIMANIFGDKWTFTSFGESHGAAIGGVLDGVPAGLHIDFDLIRSELERRSAKGTVGASQRAQHEPDEVEWLSGVLDGVTLGPPIAAPCDSPKLVKVHLSPKVFAIISCKSTTFFANMQKKHKKMRKSLVISKKSSNFAAHFALCLWRLH